MNSIVEAWRTAALASVAAADITARAEPQGAPVARSTRTRANRGIQSEQRHVRNGSVPRRSRRFRRRTRRQAGAPSPWSSTPASPHGLTLRLPVIPAEHQATPAAQNDAATARRTASLVPLPSPPGPTAHCLAAIAFVALLKRRSYGPYFTARHIPETR